MDFIPATTEHLDEICRITDEAKAQLKGMGVDQWQRGYPSRDFWLQDIQIGRVWLATEDQQVLGAFLFQTTPDISYNKIDGSWLSNAPYATIHRVCVSDSCKGQGVAGRMFAHAMDMARKQGFASVRIDTHAENRPMQRALEKTGFRFCGTVTLIGGCEDGSPRIAFEYLL